MQQGPGRPLGRPDQQSKQHDDLEPSRPEMV